MAGVFPVEAEQTITKLIFGMPNLDFGTPGVFEIGMYSNELNTLNNSSTLANIIKVEEAGNPGAQPKITAPADWTLNVSNQASTTAKFTAAADWVGITIKGFYVATIPAEGGQSRLLFFQDDISEYAFRTNSTYEIVLNVGIS